ncbi:MAG: hypothetical protein ACRYF0_15785 [Janthinobacterium lividum]
MIINTIAELCVQHDKPLNLVRVAWLAGRNMRFFQQAFTQLRGIITQLGVGRVVLELNAMPDIPVYDQIWLSKVFMPALLKLPLQQVVVVLSARRVYNQQVVEGVLAASAMSILFDVQFFAQPEAALAWLTDDSPRLPALLREWASGCGSHEPATDEVAEPRAPYGRRLPT